MNTSGFERVMHAFVVALDFHIHGKHFAERAAAIVCGDRMEILFDNEPSEVVNMAGEFTKQTGRMNPIHEIAVHRHQRFTALAPKTPG